MTQKKNETRNGVNLDAIDALLKDFNGPDEIMGRGGLVEQLTKVLVERALKGELSHLLGYAKGEKCSDGDEEGGSGLCRRC